MNFVQFHIGDWDSSTRLLSPLEKGVYIDLLFLYYSLERPLMRSECERIARAYTNEEKAALEYVLNRFFSVEGDVYKQRRCDQEIEAIHAKSLKAAASAKARWDREKANALNRQKLSEQMQSEYKRNADAMLTDNRKPLIKEDTDVSSRQFSENEAFELESSHQKKASPVPFKQIVEIYNAKLGDALGVCRQLNAKRQAWLRARYKDISLAIGSDAPADVLVGFGQFYDKIARSDFLMGRKTDFRATFDWIHQSSNYLKIYEGNYENGPR